MQTIELQRTSEDSANLEVSVCKLGTFITAGRTTKLLIPIKDSPQLRLLSANLNDLKAKQYSGVINVKFSSDHNYSMDQSIWLELADALFAFSLCVDLIKLKLN